MTEWFDRPLQIEGWVDDDGEVADDRVRMGYVSSFDGIRALAVLGVMAAHLALAGLGGAAVGVHVFFTLSGFLITRLLLEERQEFGGVDLLRFWQRRIARLMPGLGAVLAGSLVYALVLADPYQRAGTLDHLPTVATYWANWHRQIVGDDAGILGHLWSLSVEEQFYVVWPVALVVLLAWVPNRYRMTGAAVGVLALAGCTAVRLSLYGTSEMVKYRTDSVGDLLLVGCAGALFTFGRRVEVPSAAAATAAAWLVGTIALSPHLGDGYLAWAMTWGFAARGVAVVVVLLYLEGHRAGVAARLLSVRPLVAIGRLSYSLYLWHILAYALAQHSHWSIRVAVAFVLAVASYRWVEVPMRRRLSPAKRTADPRPSVAITPLDGPAIGSFVS